MAQNTGPRLPSSGAGITNFTDEYKSRLMLSPVGVIVFAVAILVFAVVLRLVF